MEQNTDISGSDVGSSDATEVSSSNTNTLMDMLDDSGNLKADSGVSEASPPQRAGSEQEPNSITEPVASKDGVETAQPDKPSEVGSTEPKSTSQDPPGVKKRIDKLTAKLKGTEEQSRNKDFEIQQLKQELAIRDAKLAAREDRLNRVDPLDRNDLEIEDLRIRDWQRTEADKFAAQQAKVIEEAKFAATVDARTEHILDEVERAISQYPTGLEVDEYRAAIGTQINRLAKSGVNDFSVMEIAKAIQDRQIKHYEPQIAEKFAPRKGVPKPISPSGSRPVKSKRLTDEELRRDMDAEFGENWAV